MARSRNIKPGFFKNEYLGILPALTRLLFEALWCEADREGRLEDRPLRIKAEYFPYDECDIDTMLAQLEHSAGKFITRYKVGDKSFIQVTNFLKHQNPHRDEAKSNRPSSTERTDIVKEISSTIPAQCKHRACLVLAGLIPDSLNLIPDTLPKDASAPVGIKPPPIPYEELRGAYNRFCPSLKKANEITSTRHANIRKLWLKYEKHELKPEGFFDALFKRAEASDFLTNRNGNWRGHPCNLDWLLEGDNHVKIIEGVFDNDKNPRRPERPTARREDFTDDITEEFLSHGAS